MGRRILIFMIFMSIQIASRIIAVKQFKLREACRAKPFRLLRVARLGKVR
jgi:hypothetical protein